MRSSIGLAAVVLLATLLGPLQTAAGQPSAFGDPAQPTSTATSSPETHPSSSQPTDARDPLRSPRSMVKAFLIAVGESEKKPGRLKDAAQCLDLSQLKKIDGRETEKQGPLLARQLEQIIEALLTTHARSLDEIPETSDGPTTAFPEDPVAGGVQLLLARSPEGLWRFSAETVAAIPELLEAVKQETKEEKEAAKAEVEAAQAVPAGFRSARATMRTFLEAMGDGKIEAASRCLDLSEIPASAQAEIGADLAERLLDVMDRVAVVVYQEIPDRPEAEPYSWRFAEVGEYGRIELARQEGGDRKGQWLFSAATVNTIEPLFKAFQGKRRVAALDAPAFWRSPRLWLLDKIPPRWKGDVWGVQFWQWMGIGILLVLGYAVFRAAFFIFCALARRIGRSANVGFSDAHIAATFRPLGMLVMLLVWWAGLRVLGLPSHIMVSVWRAMKLVMTVVGVWSSYRLIDLAADYFAALAARSKSRLDDVLVPLVRKTLKIVVVVMGIVLVLIALDVKDVTLDRLLAGLGIGGLAFAFAAKDTIANFFGSVTVILDRPFQVGDWVKIGDSEGTVETVGLRSSRIRTFYNSQITIPNSDLTTLTVDNMGRRQFRRISCKLSVTYATTPDQLEAFCEGVRELIRKHPFTRKDYYIVWVNEFADSAINILLYCFHETPDWVTELRERHRLFLDILRLAKRMGVEFAFPTQTIHIARPGEGDAEPSPTKPDGPVHGAPDDAIAWGRTEAAKVAEASLRDAGEITTNFEFPEA